MGTNYYWYERGPCECCGQDVEPVHIGKSSAGWHFSLRVYPDDKINTLEDWKAMFAKNDSKIKSEYGTVVTADEMIAIITDRSWSGDGNILRNVGLTAKWFRENDAHEGLNGLAAHNVDGRHCIGNGEGTYDYIIGNFS